MRALLFVAAIGLAAAPVMAEPLTKSDRAQLTSLPVRFAAGWLHNSRSEVMSLFTPDAVFIPHDGVKPHVGKAAIEAFWFPRVALQARSRHLPKPWMAYPAIEPMPPSGVSPISIGRMTRPRIIGPDII